MDQQPATTGQSSYNDDDLVYVDPDTKAVVGLVQWSASGKPQPLERPEKAESADDRRGARKRRHRYYPWGTYRSMKKIFKLEGKQRSMDDRTLTLDQAMEKAMKEPYWD